MPEDTFRLLQELAGTQLICLDLPVKIQASSRESQYKEHLQVLLESGRDHTLNGFVGAAKNVRPALPSLIKGISYRSLIAGFLLWVGR
jgi:hypothetical protein